MINLPETIRNSDFRMDAISITLRDLTKALLNGLLLPYANWLPRKYNAHAVFELSLAADVRIVHYISGGNQFAYGNRRPFSNAWSNPEGNRDSIHSNRFFVLFLAN